MVLSSILPAAGLKPIPSSPHQGAQACVACFDFEVHLGEVKFLSQTYACLKGLALSP